MMKDNIRILQIHLTIEYWVMIPCTADDEKEDSS